LHSSLRVLPDAAAPAQHIELAAGLGLRRRLSPPVPVPRPLFGRAATSGLLAPDLLPPDTPQALSTVCADLGMLHPALPEVGLRERAQELAQGVVRQHVTACFAALQQRVTAAVVRCQQQLLEASQPGANLGGQGSVLASTFSYISAVLQKGIVAVLQVGAAGLAVGAAVLRGAPAAANLLARLRLSTSPPAKELLQGSCPPLALWPEQPCSFGAGLSWSKRGASRAAPAQLPHQPPGRAAPPASSAQGVKAYESHQRLLAAWHDAFIDLVQGQLQHFFMALLASFMDLTGAGVGLRRAREGARSLPSPAGMRQAGVP
jgi:hypothetical protein